MKHALSLIIWCAVLFVCAQLVVDAMLTEDEVALKRLREHIAEVRR